MSPGYRVAVVGATGQVGSLMLELLRERGFPADVVVPFASERSVGRELDGGLVVQALTDESASSRIIANPNCSTMQMVVALKPIHDEAGIERLVISTYQAVSGTNRSAVDELLSQSHALLHEQQIDPPAQYAHQIAFNVLPHAGSFAPGEDHTDEERKLMFETRKILGDESIRVSATCVRVPVMTGHSEAVNVQTRDPLSPERARELLASAEGIVVLDDPGRAVYPMAIRDEVFVGRIRRDPGHDRALDMWIVADNLHKGAATNAVQLAEKLHERGLVKPRQAVTSA